jgi:DNA-binding IscR family transcriptional regulator
MYLVASDFAQGRPGWTATTLSARFATPSRALGQVLRALRDAGMLMESEDGRLLPGRDLARIALTDVVATARDGDGPPETRTAGLPHVDAVADEIDAAIGAALGTRTLRDLVQ